tara:strand:- start:1383 stop:3161 length:1779 start_codon:yes stop_codon:yes gene_type:complete
MSCSNRYVNDIESIYASRDEQFKHINTQKNFVKYAEVVENLYDFFKQNEYNNNLLILFTKLYSKLHRRNDIIVKKSFLVYTYQRLIKENIIPYNYQFWLLIQKKPARSSSGVNSFAILLSDKPNGQNFTCKHNCYFCPDVPGVARSYLPKEPAVARGLENNWDPIKQIESRLYSLLMQGHEIDKLELIIEGGTYTEFPINYLYWFHSCIFFASNTFFDSEPKRDMKSLKEEMNINKNTKVRVIGICIETRPDAIDDHWIRFFRNSGTTRIQLGVQHTDDTILKKINRGHTFDDSVKAVEYLKNQGFKVDIHLLPDMPFSTPEKDLEMFNIVFNTSIIQPDQIKIYPCEATDYTVIKKWYENGKYVPYSEINSQQLVNVVYQAMLWCKPWIRIPRIVRDIPIDYISAGNKMMNLREIVDKKITENNKITWDIRSREICRNKNYSLTQSRIFIDSYYGSNSREFFISVRSYDKKALFGFIRLRIPPKNHNPVFSSIKNTGLIRELHVYNILVPVGENKKNSSQHQGIGKKLIKIAEWISWFYCLRGISVITGEGVRDYYHNRGYKSIETYAIKYFILQFKVLIVLIFSLILFIL